MRNDVSRNPKTGLKWRNVKVRQELVDEVKKELAKKAEYPSLSQFVSEAIQLRLRTLAGEEEPREPVALELGRKDEGQIWNVMAQYNMDEEECEHKEAGITTMLADLPLSSSACRLTGIQCSLYTCPRTKI